MNPSERRVTNIILIFSFCCSLLEIFENGFNLVFG